MAGPLPVGCHPWFFDFGRWHFLPPGFVRRSSTKDLCQISTTLVLRDLMSGPLYILMTLFAPLNKTLVRWGHGLEKRIGKENVLGANKVDIDKAIDLAVAKDKDSEVEAEILKSIVSFNDVGRKAKYEIADGYSCPSYDNDTGRDDAGRTRGWLQPDTCV
jgi:hypothetical protein